MFDLMLFRAEGNRAAVIGAVVVGRTIDVWKIPYVGPKDEVLRELVELADEHRMVCEWLFWEASGESLMLARSHDLRGPSILWAAEMVRGMEKHIDSVM